MWKNLAKSFKHIKKITELENIFHEKELASSKLYEDLIRKEKALSDSLELKRQELEEEFQKKWQEAKEDIYTIAEDIKKQGLTNKHKIALRIDEISRNKSHQEKQERKHSREKLKHILPNMLVFSEQFNESGKVIKIKKDKAYIQFKKIKSWVNIDELSRSHKKTNHVQDAGYIEKSNDVSTIFDARGMRRDSFLQRTEIKVFDVINGDIPYLDIIHGHGDGILKGALYQFLKKFDDIDYDYVEGNQGTTRISLKN